MSYHGEESTRLQVWKSQLQISILPGDSMNREYVTCVIAMKKLVAYAGSQKAAIQMSLILEFRRALRRTLANSVINLPFTSSTGRTMLSDQESQPFL